jgi:uncharacterized protein YndB with AHSA1/START domain
MTAEQPMKMTLPFTLDRSITIRATPETVFRFFTDNKRWASWWGQGSTIDPRPGGHLLIRYPGGVEASGEVLEISKPERIVFTFGFASGTPMPPGSSRVTIRLADQGASTRVTLTHELADENVRNEHIQGWRYQMSVFANAVADEVNAQAEQLIDGWLAAWSLVADGERKLALAQVAEPGVCFRDRFSMIEGLDELVPHIGAAQRFMPSMRLERKGPVRHCQGMVLADWIGVAPDGQQRASGTNAFEMNAAGRVASVMGFWN